MAGAAVPEDHLIVGIGASAGGIRALASFFAALPARTGMAFVIVTHRSATRESHLPEVIGSMCPLPVRLAANGDAPAPDTVLVMPAGAAMSVEAGRLRLDGADPVHPPRMIDGFFSALAADQGDRVVGIVLSGADSDGTLGVKAIKEHGGVTLAQRGGATPPEFAMMPDSAIASGMIDFAIAAEDMPARLISIRDARDRLDPRLRAQVDGGLPDDTVGMADMQDRIAQLLRRITRHDFKGYKSRTFFRRVGRRMQVRQCEAIEDYIALLEKDPDEVVALFRDLLISVTGFFRDPEAFEALAELVVPRLLAGRGADEIVRIWVPGCATGEEVYSIAILVHEQLEGQMPRPRVQIFATDIDETSLGVARAARYPEERLSGLSPARIARYFRKDGESLVLVREVREMCIFSPHSVISDPPFSRMDMVSCRNLLIYLGPDLQKQVLPTFHYALRPGGFLFLGTSERIGDHDDLFSPVDKRRRIYCSRDLGGVRRRLPMSLEAMSETPDRLNRATPPRGMESPDLSRRIERQVWERHAPAHVAVNRAGNVVHFSARTGRYLEVPSGAPSRQLIDLARPELRGDLRAALRQAISTSATAQRHAAMIENGAELTVAITVEPLDDPTEREPLFVVLFRPGQRGSAGLDAPRDGVSDPSSLSAAEIELREMRETRQSLIEEYETALEELKASNEELLSVNEEAQSANEELQASREEMQSLNEELSTVNAELGDKVEELDRNNADLRNLYEATRIASVFLDADQMIRNFTPATTAFFNLRPADIGRPLTELNSVLNYPELPGQIREVFETGQTIEHRLSQGEAGVPQYLVRLVPYRTESGITGVVVTFLDISSLAQAEAHQNVLIAELNHRVKNMLAVIISITNATRRSAGSVEDFGNTLIDRLHGMSRAYALLSGATWTRVPLRDLIDREVSVYGRGRIKSEGAEVALLPAQALALGMVIHELATNAAKYGAFSGKDGWVCVRWELREDRLHFTWRESGGPPVTQPEGRGFGLNLIEGQVVHQLGGSVQMTFAPGGFDLALQIPWRG